MIIKTSNDLKEICSLINDYIAFDTEFSRSKGVYYPTPSLLQFCFDNGKSFICDLYSQDIDWSPIIQILVDPKIIKVFHAIKQDLDVLYKIFSIRPQNIFDVQVASMFLGDYETPSYDILVKDFLNEKVDKTLQFSDWVQRPLSKNQLLYAERDVTYLYNLFPKIKNALGKDKYLWANEEMQRIIHFDFERNCEELLEKLIMGIKKDSSFTSKHVSVYRKLIIWREKFSLENDKIRSRVLEDSILQDLVNKIARNNFTNDISKIKRVKIKKQILESIMQTINFSEVASDELEKSEEVLKKCFKKREVIFSKPKSLELLKSLLKSCSKKSKITQSLIAKKDDIITIIAQNQITKKFSQGWRYEVFGKYVENLLKNLD